MLGPNQIGSVTSTSVITRKSFHILRVVFNVKVRHHEKKVQRSVKNIRDRPQRVNSKCKCKIFPVGSSTKNHNTHTVFKVDQ